MILQQGGRLMLVSRRFAFVIGCALLASCGGGDSGGSPPPTGGGGTPTPTPAPTPTPTPSPTPTYQTLAQLTGARSFLTACAGNFSDQIVPVQGLGDSTPRPQEAALHSGCHYRPTVPKATECVDCHSTPKTSTPSSPLPTLMPIAPSPI
ncbi:hypothetical protein CHX26_09820 [Porphyrobacter sp. HT-58-2]|nr:hypothetical protein CHX26_09820 [Porphyrobacter sp. HT-58-2]